MEYYSSERCVVEELLLLKDMEFYTNFHDLSAFNNNLDSSNFPTDISSSLPHCFEDYSNLPLDVQTLPYPPFGEGELTQDSPNANIVPSQTAFYDFQEDYSSYPNSVNYANHEYNESNNDGSVLGNGNVVAPNSDPGAQCKDEPVPEISVFSMGFCPENESKNKMKKINGQPSKNLMAERRRRKRLNDRLSMLRSVVPKISKMDRTSILGDTIDYMKELLERINNLQEEMDDEGLKQLGSFTIFNDTKPNEILARNSPKMEVERGNGDTRIKICCAMKPGLLLSTMNTLEELGLEIQQCVISCFSDFTMQASCSQELKEREIIEAEDVKQALFRKAGYGGRCL